MVSELEEKPLLNYSELYNKHEANLILFEKFYPSKGQIMSECIYEIIDFPKYHQKNLIDFCPGRFYRLGTCDLF